MVGGSLFDASIELWLVLPQASLILHHLHWPTNSPDRQPLSCLQLTLQPLCMHGFIGVHMCTAVSAKLCELVKGKSAMLVGVPREAYPCEWAMTAALLPAGSDDVW